MYVAAHEYYGSVHTSLRKRFMYKCDSLAECFAGALTARSHPKLSHHSHFLYHSYNMLQQKGQLIYG